MPYVIYDTRDSAIVKHPRTNNTLYKTLKSAFAARTKMLNSNHIKDNTEEDKDGMIKSWYAVDELVHYKEHIEQFITVKNLMSGKDVRQSINTPLCCDVSSETYWSM